MKLFAKKQIILFVSLALLSQALYARNAEAVHSRQSPILKALYQPSSYVLNREERGGVTIYDGLTETHVNAALDNQFDRIQNMMFVRVKMTSPDGQVLKDPLTGQDMVENDGCD